MIEVSTYLLKTNTGLYSNRHWVLIPHNGVAITPVADMQQFGSMIISTEQFVLKLNEYIAYVSFHDYK